ncbi:MAG: hypothetical protein ACXAEF_08080 [Candidatus Thorarchaeota archaeon]|jgi:hypothetical protein
MVLCIIATITGYRLYKGVGTRFFKNAVIFFFFVGLWSTAFIVPSLLFDQIYYNFVLGWQYIFLPFGILSLAFMISAMESVSREQRTLATNTGFLFAGGVIAGLYSPTSHQLVWSEAGWVNEFSLLFQIGRAVIFIIIVYSTFPLVVRIFKRLRISIRKDYATRALFWVIIIILPFIRFSQPFRDIAPTILLPLYHPSVIVSMNTLFLLLIVNLFIRHPTILFAGTNEIEEIYIIKRDSGLPLYHFNFVPENGIDGKEILSAFFTGIRHYVKHSLGSGEIERIHVGDHELVIHDGILTYGILISKKSTDIAENLLRLVVREFENRFGLAYDDHVRPKVYREFDQVISRYFEFALRLRDVSSL